MANNLELQGGTYHVRLAIPKDVQNAFGGKRILSRSLETGSHQEAMERRLPILAGWKGQIKVARVGVPPPPGWQIKTADAVRELRDFSRGRMLSALGDHIPMPTVTAQEISQFASDHPEWLALADHLSAPETIERLGGEVGVQKSMHAGFSNALVALINRKYRLTPDEQAELAKILREPESAKNYCPITNDRLSNFKLFREKRNIAEKTIDQQQSKLRKLATFLESNNKRLDFDNVSDWLGSMELSSKTLTQYTLAGNIFWEWAIKYDKDWKRQFGNDKNPFEKHDLPRARGKAKAEKMRKAFELEEIKKVYKSAVDNEQTAVADLIMLGYYTGARIEEICQLTTKDVIEIDGFKFLDIKDSKTVAGIRQVPIHPAIEELIKRLASKSEDDFLISSASNNKYGIRSDALSKAFGRLKTSLKFGPELVFHSIRKTFITLLHRGGTTGPIIAEIVGHETGTVTYDVYNHGASAQQKHDAIARMPLLN